jgi:hypothetical protein
MRSTRNSISLSCCSIFRLHNQASSLPGCPTSGNSINLLRQHPRNPQPCGLDSAHDSSYEGGKEISYNLAVTDKNRALDWFKSFVGNMAAESLEP